MTHLINIFLILLHASVANAARFLAYDATNQLLAVSPDNEDTATKLNDYVCLLYKKNSVTCGTVSRINASGYLVKGKMDGPKQLMRGDYLAALRLTASQPELSDELEAIENRGDLGFELRSLTFSSGLPMGIGLQLEQGISRRATIGIMPMFINHSVGTGTLLGGGFFGTFNFYSRRLYEGFWFHAAIGEKMGKITQGDLSENSGSFVGIATIGWRIPFNSGVHLGLSGGGQYFFYKKLTEEITLDFSGFIPTVRIDVGFTF